MGGLDGGDLVGATRTGGAAEGRGALGGSDLATVSLDLGDVDGTVGAGGDVDDLVVGKTGVLAGVEVDKVTLRKSAMSSSLSPSLPFHNR